MWGRFQVLREKFNSRVFHNGIIWIRKLQPHFTRKDTLHTQSTKMQRIHFLQKAATFMHEQVGCSCQNRWWTDLQLQNVVAKTNVREEYVLQKDVDGCTVTVLSFATVWNMIKTKLMNGELIIIMSVSIDNWGEPAWWASPTLIMTTVPLAWNNGIYVCIIHIDTKARHWTYYSACVLFVDVESYRLTVLRHHWHCCYVAIVTQYNLLRLAHSIPWMR